MTEQASTEAAKTAEETTKPAAEAAVAADGTVAATTETQTDASAVAAAAAVAAKTYTQEDLDRITAKVKKNASYRARKEAEAYYKGLQQGTQVGRPQEKTAEPETPKEPQRDQYDSYEAYLEARADYRAERKVESALAKQRETDTQRTAKTEQEKAQERFMAEVAALVKEMPDAQEILETSDSPLTNVMRDAIHASDAPARIAVHLAQNPDEAQRIAALSSAKQAVEIGKLDARFATKPNGAGATSAAAGQAGTTIAAAAAARAPSKAPAPINPVGGKVASADDEPDAKNQADKWMEWRNRQLRARMNVGNSKQ
jgi:hypothetical protein